MILQIEGQISIFDIMPYIKETDGKPETHNCPFYMFVKNGEPYAKKFCDADWSKCGQCSINNDFYKERNRLMEEGLGLADAIGIAREFIYKKYGSGGEKASA